MGLTALFATEKLHLWQETRCCSVLTCVCFCVSFSRDEHEPRVTAQEDLGQSQNRQIWYTRGRFFIFSVYSSGWVWLTGVREYVGDNMSGIESSWDWTQCWHGTKHIKCSTLALVPLTHACMMFIPMTIWTNYSLLPILVSSGRELLLLYNYFSEARQFSLWVGVQMFTKLFRPHFRGWDL